jgi:hypothetical protein
MQPHRIRLRSRKLLILVIASVVLTCWYVVRFDGDPQPVAPLLVAPLHEGGWYSQPTLLQNVNEPGAIYIVPGLQGPDGLFEALRLDVNSGGRSSARILFGPGSDYVPFESAEVVGSPTIELHGLSLQRPTFHLFTFPDGGGPGFHAVNSATGVAHVVVGTPTAPRTLLTRTVINSSRMLEMKSLLWSDRARRLAAFLSREPDGWTLYLFSLVTTQTGTNPTEAR